MEEQIQNRIKICQGDITDFEVDVIVNAANSSLSGGGGVDGAIHRAAGPQLLKACQTIGGCPTGQARITKGYDLKSDYVIHTVGPIYKGHKEDPVLLGECYEKTFALAKEYGLHTIAFPAISCGVYGYPVGDACKIALEKTIEALTYNTSINQVFFVLFSNDYETVYKKTFGKLAEIK